MLKIYIATTTGPMLVSNLPVLHVTLSVFMLMLMLRKIYIIADNYNYWNYVLCWSLISHVQSSRKTLECQ